MSSKATILIVGGTGKTGRRLATCLDALGHNVRIGSRSAELPFVWEDETSWGPALEEVDGLYIAHHDVTDPDAGGQIGRLSQLALTRGVRRQVLLSGRVNEDFYTFVEGGMRAGGADWTILRPAWFMQNFSEMFFFDAVLEGVITLPVGDATEPFIDVEDIAEVATRAFFDDRHIGQTYELTGPRLIGFAEAADELTKAIGREIVFNPITQDSFRESILSSGLPEHYAETYSGIADGKLAYITDDVERILGRKPIDFSEYVRRTAATGVWNR